MRKQTHISWALPVVVIVALVVGISLYCYMKKTSDSDVQNTQLIQVAPQEQYVEWKAYTNTKHGYQISYPVNAALTTSDLNRGAAGEKSVSTFPADADFITITSGPAYVSVCDDCGPYGVGIGNVPTKESVIIGGKTYPATGFTNNVDGSSKVMFVDESTKKVVRYGYQSEFRKPLTAAEIEKAEAVAQQILASLSFQ